MGFVLMVIDLDVYNGACLILTPYGGGKFYLQSGQLTGLEIRMCQESRAPLNPPGAPSNFCREPKYVLVSRHVTR